jgi:hypothetical protein
MDASPADPLAPPEARCRNCGTPLTGPFCHGCGQKDLRGIDRSVRSYFGEFFHALTHLDGRFWITLRKLILSPGALTADFLSGMQRRYLLPLHIFLFGNVLYFFFTALTDLNPKLHEHSLQPYGALAEWLIDRKLSAAHLDLAAYAPVFNAASEGLAKTLVFICVPIFAALLRLVNWRQPGAGYFDDLVFSTHYFTFVILAPFTLLPVILQWTVLPLARLAGAWPVRLLEAGVLVAILLWIVVYLWLALRRVYPAPWPITTLKTLYGVAALVLTGIVYKFVLLLVTLVKT